VTAVGSSIEALDAVTIAGRLPTRWRRVLLFGDRGTGKSTLARDVAQLIAGRTSVACVGADPGLPAFGLPGAVALAEWHGAWRVIATEPLCTLDAGRFRVPLLGAVGRLLRRATAECVLVDAPGVARGVAGAELLAGLAAALEPDVVVVLARPGAATPLEAELAALAVPWCRVACAPESARPDAATRARVRTQAWDEHLASGVAARIDAAALRLIGTPPPLDALDAWTGRQAALYERGRIAAFGEVVRLHDGCFELRLDRSASGDALLVRDAVRRADGALVTAPLMSAAMTKIVGSPRPSGRAVGFDVGPFGLSLVNGVFGDPLVLLRMRGSRRALLLDLGDSTALSRRVMHRVTDVFVTHAHFDHVAGLQWLLRARMGSVVPACRIFGPPGLHGHVAGSIAAVRWDRIGEAGPEFVVGEVHAGRIEWVRIKAGAPSASLPAQPVRDGEIVSEAAFSVRAIELDHGIPVLSFAIESRGERRIRKDRLAALGLSPGPWLGRLKRALTHGETASVIALPDGRTATVAALANDLVEGTPPVRVVYATDFADTPVNRAKLAAHARGADALICEATFLAADADQARRTQHLTARACGEIAAAAGVGRLVPFHFSKRYDGAPRLVYAEVGAACAGVRLLTGEG